MKIIYDDLSEFAEVRLRCENTRKKSMCKYCPLYDRCEINDERYLRIMDCKIEKYEKGMNMEGFTTENKDDINSAIDGMCQFCHSFCMNCEETKKTNDLVFRCKECPFGDKETRTCSVKVFLNKYGTPEQIDKSTCMGGL